MKSPFRYPGAKSRIVPTLMQWIRPCMAGKETFLEPFVGGGSVLLHVAKEFPYCRLVVNDLDNGIYAFWKCMTSKPLTEALSSKIRATIPTVQEHERQKHLLDSSDIVEAAFAALFLNRTSFSGILTSGPIGGRDAQSTTEWTVGCRYNAELLVDSIMSIHYGIGSRLSVLNKDFQVVMRRYDRSTVGMYCDCPYYLKGNQLYRHGMSSEDHARLRDLLKHLKNAKFVASYDSVPEVRALYDGFEVAEIPVKYSIEGDNRESWSNKFELVFYSSGLSQSSKTIDSGREQNLNCSVEVVEPIQPTSRIPVLSEIEGKRIVMEESFHSLGEDLVLGAYLEFCAISSDMKMYSQMNRDRCVSIMRRAMKMGIPKPTCENGVWLFKSGSCWDLECITLEE